LVKTKRRPGSRAIAARSGVRRQSQRADVVDRVVIGVRIDVVVHHQPGQRAAIVFQIALLDVPGGRARQVEMALHIAADALLHLRLLFGVEGVEGVIEVEHPGRHMPEIRLAMGCRRVAHGRTMGEGAAPSKRS